jgi:hypothetical protein
MLSKYAGPSVTTGPTQPPLTTSEPPRVDSVHSGEGWKKVERKRWKGKREKKVGPAGGVPTWADIARGGCGNASRYHSKFGMEDIVSRFVEVVAVVRKKRFS